MKGFYIFSKYILFLVLLTVVGTSCKKKDAGPVPTYVHIDSFAFSNANTPAGRASTHKISAVWVYYNNNPVGVFDLPATIPVITSGTSGLLTLRPGVVMSGLNNFISAYPFYASDTSRLTSQPGSVVNYTPTTQFVSAARSLTISNFDTNTGPRFHPINGTVPVTINLLQNGVINLAMPADSLAEDSSAVNFSINASKEAFIEFDYKNTIPFAVGLRASIAGSIFYKYYLTGVYPSDNWQKFYLSVRDFAAQYKGDSYQLYIKANLPDGTNSGTVLLDNIQFVYFD